VSTSELALEVAGLGPLETSRIWGRYSVIKLYDKILKQCKLCNRNKITSDIIVEDTVPDIGYVNFGDKLGIVSGYRDAIEIPTFASLLGISRTLLNLNLICQNV